ncbi:hypothetical protein EXS74_01695, partial [Candidatus Woesearchaeota archaeon]|nr:hypothetical protein [Candidatus Woesearchaeota archaeon]
MQQLLLQDLQKRNSLLFENSFYDFTSTAKDQENFDNYRAVAMRYSLGMSPFIIASELLLSQSSISKWIYGNTKPMIIHQLEDFLVLGFPDEKLKWLSLNSTRGGLFTGPWIQVPEVVEDYNSILKVLKQLEKLEGNNSSEEIQLSFAYFLGMLVGDSSKTGIQRNNRVTRRVQIRLSKAYPTNEQLGEYTAFCVRSLGLRMERRKDCPPGKLNTHPFYTWISQSSPFFQWVYKTVLGLSNQELTTYDKIHLEWILTAPREFKVSFIQGLADSDGFVDFSSHQVGIITQPNTELIQKILSSLGIRSTPKLLTRDHLWVLMVHYRDAYSLPIFSPQVKSYRYQYVEK